MYTRYAPRPQGSLLCYLGWFWPIWDRKRQTFADKIMRTVVVIQPADSAR